MKVSKHTAFDPKEAGKFYNILKSKTTPTNELIGNIIFEKSIQVRKGKACFCIAIQKYLKYILKKKNLQTTVILVHLVTRTSL